MATTEARPLTPGQVAAMFGVTVGTVGQWAEEGKLAYFKTPGGHRRFRRSTVDAFLATFEPDRAAS